MEPLIDDFVISQDNTRVQKPVIIPLIQYNPDEVYYTDQDGNRFQYNRQQYLNPAKQLDPQITQAFYKQHQEQKDKEKAGRTAGGFLTFIDPATWAGPIFRNNGKSYFENATSGEGFGNPILNLGFDVLLPVGAGRSYNIARQIISPSKRAAHAYVSILPTSYSNIGKRFQDWTKSIMSGKDADIAHPKWSWDQLRETSTAYLPKSLYNREEIAALTRDDAWRIYNRLEPIHNMYIKNPDGTYSYNLDLINKLSEKNGRATFKPWVERNAIPIDYVTGSGGFLGKMANYNLGSYGSKQYGVQVIEDTWDLQPFSREFMDETILQRLNLGSLRNYKPFKALDNFIGRFEVGSISGGKPFKMRTQIPYTKFFTHRRIVDGKDMLEGKEKTIFGFKPTRGWFLPNGVHRYLDKGVFERSMDDILLDTRKDRLVLQPGLFSEQANLYGRTIKNLQQ